MRVCLDTNSLLRLFGNRSPFADVKNALLTGRLELIVSTAILLEYEEVVTRLSGRERWNQINPSRIRSPRKIQFPISNCEDTDKASAALVADLKQRGLLDDTLVIWGGEFGRTPMVQGGNDGRDHHNRSFTMWLAGGGVKRGYIHGETDDLGFNVVRDPVHVHDLHATILHLLGFDHTKLTYRFQGRDFRLTDVHGHLVKSLLA